MKKMMCIFVLLAFIGSTVIMTGCGSSGSGWVGLLAAGLIISAVASGGTAVPAFAASTRANLTFADTSSYVAEIYINDSATPLAKDLAVQVSNDNSTLKLKNDYPTGDIFVQGDKVEYRVVFKRSGKTNGLSVIKVADLAPGTNTAVATATPETTTRAIVYQQWKNVKLAATNKNYQDFESSADGSIVNFATVQSDVETDLPKVLADKDADATDSFTTAQTKIDAAAQAIEAPTTTPSTVLEGLYKFVDDGEDVYFVVKKSGEDYYAGVSNDEEQNPVTFLSGDNLVVSGNDVIFKLVDTDETVTGVLSVGTTITLTAKTTTATTTETEKFTVTKLTAQAAATNPTNDHIQGIYMGTFEDGETIAVYLERGATTTNIYIVAEEPVTLSSAAFSVDDDEHVILNFAGNHPDGAFTGVMNFGIHGDAISMRINQNNDEMWIQGLRRVF